MQHLLSLLLKVFKIILIYSHIRKKFPQKIIYKQHYLFRMRLVYINTEVNKYIYLKSIFILSGN